jgi:Asp-tRNA(Asn)/Glu-tRNA(Gln) amidotransferase A subunit family amidase
LRANRVRRLLQRDMEAALADVDLYVHPSFGGPSLSIGNLTGHPTLVAPAGFRPSRSRGSTDYEAASGDEADEPPREVPFSVSFTGKPYDEARLFALVLAWQASTDHHRRHPDL